MNNAILSPSEDLNYYFRSAFSVTCVIFGVDEKAIKVLVVKRQKEPYKGFYALPAGMVYPNDSIEERVDTIVKEVTGTSRFYKKQIRAFTDKSRHPLGRVISIGYYSFVNIAECNLQQGNLESESIWIDLKSVPELAFDHNEIVQAAKRRLLAKLSTQLAGFEMLSEKFTLKQLQEMYEAALGHELDKRNFRRKILSQDVIVETGELLTPWDESGKAPMLYKLNRELYDNRRAAGDHFEIF
ncbi:MAG: NUDIX hydrolase [Bacteroidetes bacterium]|nr:NUDIX hydrolase [Bacteroidota bacterium]